MAGRHAFRLHLDRCTGCSACVLACRIENGLAADVAWRRVHTFNHDRRPGFGTVHYSLACNHCRKPVCLEGCPAGAYRRDPASGAVLLDDERCVGCRYCTWLCPYDAPRFQPRHGVVSKCTLCVLRIGDGEEPACVAACPLEALVWDDDPADESPPRPPGLPETGIEPRLKLSAIADRVQPPRPAVTGTTDPCGTTSATPAWEWGGLADEWPLLFFSVVLTSLVAWFATAVTRALPFDLAAFLALAAAMVGISTIHLGRPFRVLRSVSNLRSSWLSREVAAFGLFVVAVSVTEIMGWRHTTIGWTTAAIGCAAVVSMDLVYRGPAPRIPTFPHSGMGVYGIVWILALTLGDTWFAGATAFGVTALYLARRRFLPKTPTSVAALRLGIGVALPLVLMIGGDNPAVRWAAVIAAVAGLALDRAELYASLRFLDPQLQISCDMKTLAEQLHRYPGALEGGHHHGP